MEYNLLLADDDQDDCLFFKEALAELPVASNLTTVNDGAALMRMLVSMLPRLPDILFLDLNMPCKNGMECLAEIKLHKQLKDLFVVIFSTSYNLDIVNLLYKKGACYYIKKPGTFDQLKTVINKTLGIMAKDNCEQPALEKFVIKP